MSDTVNRADVIAAVEGLAREFSDLGSPTSKMVLDLAAERIRALPAASGWQDIATAPRDGTRFFASGGGLDDVDICSYNARIGCWDCGGVTLDDTDYEPEGYNRPTHWRPMLDGPRA